MTSLANYNTMFSAGTQAAVAFKSGNVWILGANRFTIGAITNGAVVCVALDLDNKRYFCRLGAAGNWNGSSSVTPATPSTGFDISTWIAAGFALHPAVTLGGTGDTITANFGDTAFTGTVPAGYTAGFPTSSYSPAKATFGSGGPAAAIIDGSLTVLAPSSASVDGATSPARKRTGKWYFEYTVDHGNQASQSGQCGICTAAAPPNYNTEYINETNSCVVTTAGNIYVGSATFSARLNGGTVIQTGLNTFAVAIDLDNKRAFFRCGTTSSTLWNASGPADPTVPSTGIDISALIGSGFAYPTIWTSAGIGNRANFGDATFVYTMPTGYSAWDATVQPPAGATQAMVMVMA